METLKGRQGARLLIHAPPQHGKSIIVSQRFPAWLLGHHPTHRIKLACYNISHATRFGWIVRDLMHSADYAELFPNRGLRVRADAPRGEWSTAARDDLRGAQPSFMALGLLTGFVGQGADTLIIDDPYSSPQDALSEVIRESVWTFWDASAKVRLNEDANVVVMFHRYHEDDLAGRLWATGEWEMVRYPARADEDPNWPDPLNRSDGAPLSPRYSSDYYDRQAESGWVWLSQFQGRPTPKEGAFFKVGQLGIIDAAPAGITARVRAWDLASTSGGGDHTAGVLVGKDDAGRFYVLDVIREQLSSDARNALMRQAAALDGKATRIRLAQDPGQAGVDQSLALTRMLAGYSITSERVSGPKETRADPVSAQVNAGNVSLVSAPWNRTFIEELRQFPLGANDDQVDAFADAFNTLTAGAAFLPAFAAGRPRPAL